MFLRNSIFFTFRLNFLTLALVEVWVEFSSNCNHINDDGYCTKHWLV